MQGIQFTDEHGRKYSILNKAIYGIMADPHVSAISIFCYGLSAPMVIQCQDKEHMNTVYEEIRFKMGEE